MAANLSQQSNNNKTGRPGFCAKTPSLQRATFKAHAILDVYLAKIYYVAVAL